MAPSRSKSFPSMILCTPKSIPKSILVFSQLLSSTSWTWSKSLRVPVKLLPLTECTHDGTPILGLQQSIVSTQASQINEVTTSV